VLDLGELDVLMMTPFSQVDVVAVHVYFLHILEDLLHVLEDLLHGRRQLLLAVISSP
jgi:hypothetical protein